MKGWPPAVARFTKVLLLCLVLFAVPAVAQTFPKLTGRVVDEAHLLSPEQVLDLTSKSEALEAQSKRQFVVATVPSLQGRTIEDYGYQLGRAWGIGQKGKDDGVILLVAPNEHQVRIETGYGARVFLTDAVSSIIIRNQILPKFKAGDFGGGIEAGADAIIKQMSLPAVEAQKNVAEAEQQQRQHQHSSGGAIPAIFWFMIIGFVLLSMMRRAGGRRYRRRRGGISPWVVLWGLDALSHSGRSSGWGGGGSSWGGGGGGGFGGFSGGGGSFGGGGASGSW
ncbi:TPM domain-containing protein [Sphingomonas sp. F9_3S_D5_B_2]